LRRQQKEKVRASQDKDRRARSLRIAKRLTLQGCVNPELKAWALDRVDQVCTPTSIPEPVEVKSRPHPPTQVPSYHRLCGFLPTADDSFTPLNSMLRLQPDDIFYDLGCGDGRVVISVVRHFRCRGIGVEVNKKLVQKGRSLVDSEFSQDPELKDRITFIEDDISHISLSDAKAVYIYMPDSSLHTLLMKVLPHCGLQDGTLLCIKDNWIREGVAQRNCRYTSSHWGGGIHCYKWRKADALPADPPWSSGASVGQRCSVPQYYA
jgi:SAM-dependent methyltransferase